MTTYYIDYENGDDSYAGDSFAAGHPWKTITGGPTAARVAPGDIIHIAKSPDPVSIGNATWTNASKTVTLATAQTQLIDDCETQWTADAATVTRNSTSRKQGTYSASITSPGSPTTNQLMAHYNIADVDLSSYQKISFWIMNGTGISNAGTWVIELCDDDACTNVIDTFDIPAIASAGRFVPITVAKNGGGNLGASIKGIRVSSGPTYAPGGSQYILLDNIMACTTSGLNLQSLISKNSSARGGTEAWYPIQSIMGTTVLIDNEVSTTPAAGQGYYTLGTSPDTVTTYKRETIKTGMATASSTQIQVVQDSGTSGSNIQFLGGYNTSNDTADGETMFDGQCGWGYGIYLSSKDFITIDHIGCFRYNYGIYVYLSDSVTISNSISGSCSRVLFLQGGSFCSVSNSFTCTGSYGIYSLYMYSCSFSDVVSNGSTVYGINVAQSSHNTFDTCTFLNNSTGIWFQDSINNNLYSCQTKGNNTSGLYNDAGYNYLFNCLIEDTSEFVGYSGSNGRLHSHDHDNTQYNHWIFARDATANMQNSVTQPGSGYAWTTTITSARNQDFPFLLPLARIACAANETITVKAYCKKSGASGTEAKLYCPAGQLDGVTEQSDTKADDTNWEELSISFTPTENGVVEVYGRVAWVSGTNYTVYWDTMTITST